MSKLGLDLGKFKKLSQDKDSATLQHSDGHQIKLALKALSPKHRGDIAAMPSQKMPEKKMAIGGKVPHYDEGTGDIEPLQVDKMPDSADQPPLDIEKLPDSSPAVPQGPMDVSPAVDMAAAEAPKSDLGKNAESSDVNKGPEVPSGDLLPEIKKDAIEAQTDNPLTQQFAPGTQMQLQGMEEQAAAQAKAGVLKQAAANDEASSLQKLQATELQHANSLQQEQTNVIKDIQNKHVDPNHYLSSLGTMHKIGNAVALIVGGFGAGLAGRDNPVQKFINDQIDRDIDAQKANIGNKLNLVSAYSKQYGDTVQGSLAAKSIMEAQALAKMTAAEASAVSPQAKANLAMAKGQMANQLAMTNMKFGAMQAFSQSGESQGVGHEAALDKMQQTMQVVDPKTAEWMAKHRVPGVGTSTQEIPPADRNKMLNGIKTLQQLQQIRQFSADNHGIMGQLNPVKRAEATTLTNNLLQTIRENNDMGVFKEASNKFEHELTGDNPLGIFAKYTQDPKYHLLEQQVSREFDDLKHINGIKGVATPVSQPYAQPATAAPGFKIVTYQGKQYKVPVK